jgi:DNA-binding CsgD family transcriptional regulator
MFRDSGTERLVEARDLAMNAGALATAAMVEVQIAACHDQRPEPEATLQAARHAETMSRRLHLDLTAALALIFQAAAHAKLGDRAAMETTLTEALSLGSKDPMIVAFTWEVRAFASIGEDDWKRALHELDMAVAAVEGMAATAPAPFYGMWALLRSANDLDGPAACELVRRSGANVNPINRGYVDYAEAITLGRAGRGPEAAAAVARADADLAGMGWYHHCARRVLAEASIADGWGDPATWLWEACVWFESAGHERLASACRSLLRRSGVPGAHTSRRHAGVPARFRSLGITRREMDVLSLLVDGLSNRELGERLYLSPRTVEKHVASLMAKTRTRTRAQLAALAASGAEPAGRNPLASSR